MKTLLIVVATVLFSIIFLIPAPASAQSGSETAVAQSALPRMPEAPQLVVTLAVGEYNGEWSTGPWSNAFYINIKEVNGAECRGTLYLTTGERVASYPYFNTLMKFTGTVVDGRLKITVGQLSLDLAVRTEGRKHILEGTAQGITKGAAIVASKPL